MKILLIRHGMTQGNYQKRYIGATDQPLCKAGIIQLTKKRYELRTAEKTRDHMTPEFIFVSPMFRCIQTAELLFPGQNRTVIPEFREMDFGIFENRAYEDDLRYSFEYRVWVDSGCESPVPGGESKRDFTERCIRGFEQAAEIMAEQTESGNDRTAAFVVHGGTIMSVLTKYGIPMKNYYDWHTENGCGYIGEWDGKFITDIEGI